MRTFPLTLAAVAMLSWAGAGDAAAQSATAERIDKVANRRLTGSPYASLSGLSYEQCERRCLAERACRALEHVRGGASASQCRLFGAFVTAHAAAHSDVGYKRPALAKDTEHAARKAAPGAPRAPLAKSAPTPHPAAPAPKVAPTPHPAAPAPKVAAAPPPPAAGSDAHKKAIVAMRRVQAPPVSAPAPPPPASSAPTPAPRSASAAAPPPPGGSVAAPPPPPGGAGAASPPPPGGAGAASPPSPGGAGAASPPPAASVAVPPPGASPAPLPPPSAGASREGATGRTEGEGAGPSRSAAPATAPPAGGGAQPVNDWAVVPVFFGTDRSRRDQAKRIGYGSNRGHRLEVGRALVTVPKAHQVPNVERPWAIRIPYTSMVLYRQDEDPKKHFTIQELKALSKEDLLALIRERLLLSRNFEKQALVFVHGYNNAFDDALFRTAQIAYDLNYDGAPFLYSWPSGSGISGYPYDRESAQQAEPYLKQFLEMVLH